MSLKNSAHGLLSVKKHGFTLVELLTVIAIIALLAAILFPVFGRVRESARRSSCQSNLKQIGLGMLQYVQDYDQKFPFAVQCNAGPDPTLCYGNNNWMGWSVLIQPYTKSTQLLQCPSEPNKVQVNADTNGFTDYFYNQNLGYNWTTEKVAVLDNPSVTITNGEGSYYHSRSWSSGMCRGYDYNTSSAYKTSGPAQADAQWSPTGGEALRHFDGANYAFADGHVKWYQPKDITCESSNVGLPTFRLQ
jgi:prepilin-type N-terminal cleavage/methylation domain-containing protein/prepilin-type processing-associated H-X9-DG protein